MSPLPGILYQIIEIYISKSSIMGPSYMKSNYVNVTLHNIMVQRSDLEVALVHCTLSPKVAKFPNLTKSNWSRMINQNRKKILLSDDWII